MFPVSRLMLRDRFCIDGRTRRSRCHHLVYDLTANLGFIGRQNRNLQRIRKHGLPATKVFLSFL